MTDSDDFVYFTCVKVKSKLRIRITSQGYKNGANCQFPRAIRKEGGQYRAPTHAVTLAKQHGKYFYRVSRSAVEIIEDTSEVPTLEKVFKEEGDCVVCMDASPEMAVAPCGHFCMCQKCATRMQKDGKSCPMCRGTISAIVPEDQIQL